MKRRQVTVLQRGIGSSIVRYIDHHGLPVVYKWALAAEGHGTGSMMSVADLWRAATLLIDQHGDSAPMLATRWADEMLAAGDTEGHAVWLRILAVVKELCSAKPPDSVH